MLYEKLFFNVRKFKWVSCNQHGDRYKKVNDQYTSCCRLKAKINNADDLANLAILSVRLNQPLKYDFDANPQCVYIDIVAKDQII